MICGIFSIRYCSNQKHILITEYSPALYTKNTYSHIFQEKTNRKKQEVLPPYIQT